MTHSTLLLTYTLGPTLGSWELDLDQGTITLELGGAAGIDFAGINCQAFTIVSDTYVMTYVDTDASCTLSTIIIVGPLTLRLFRSLIV